MLDGEIAIFDERREHQWEGLVAKDDSSTYEHGTRTRSWIKVKHRIRQGWPEEGIERKRV